MTTIKVVLFDLGNVLVSYTPESFWMTLGFEEKTRRRGFEKGVLCLSTKFEMGKIDTERFLGELETLFKKKFTREELRKAVASVLTRPIRGTNSLVARVVKSTEAALVSNTNEMHYVYCLRAVPSLKFLPKHFLSYKLGVMKPNPRFYDAVIRSLGEKPSSMVFIDDVEENVSGAEKAGMKGIVFKNAGQIEKELESLNILKP
ncbi:MAG: HAD family phosphatase [Bacteroidota bacterium]